MAESYLKKRGRFNKISKDIKSVKIQGARNIAKAALKAYHLIPTKNSKRKLIKLRPTEPMLERVLKEASSNPYDTVLKHFDQAQDKINRHVFRLINKGDVIFTECRVSVLCRPGSPGGLPISKVPAGMRTNSMPTKFVKEPLL